jgi:hypothetical protein
VNVLLLLLLLATALARKPVPPPPDFWSAEGLEEAVTGVLASIEHQSGRTFTTRPRVELASPEVFARVLTEEERLILDVLMRDTPEALRRPAAQAGVVPGYLGKYAVFDDTLFLCRGEIEAAAWKLGVDPVALARPVLVHELVHALHDQQVDLVQQLRAVPDLDGFHANQSTAEGLATWVTERVADELGFREQVTVLEGLQGWKDGALVEKEAYPVWASYGLGRTSIAAHFEAGGFDQVWKVAITPPNWSRGVFDPSLAFTPRPPPSRDWSALLLGSERKLTDADWIVSTSLLGDYDLVGEAIVAGNEPELRTVASHLRDAWHLVGTLPDRDGEIRVLQFAEPKWALAYLDLLQAQHTANAARQSVPGVSEVDISFTDWDRVPADRAVLRDSRIAGAPGVFTERHAAWVVRGDTVVVVVAGRFRPGLRLQWTVEEVLSRLGSAPPSP